MYGAAAVDDIDMAFDWLAERAPNAAADLLRAIARAERHLLRNPEIYRVVRENRHGGIRRVNLRPFRYQLYFQVRDSEVLVLACLHASRSPRTHRRIVTDRR